MAAEPAAKPDHHESAVALAPAADCALNQLVLRGNVAPGGHAGVPRSLGRCGGAARLMRTNGGCAAVRRTVRRTASPRGHVVRCCSARAGLYSLPTQALQRVCSAGPASLAFCGHTRPPTGSRVQPHAAWNVRPPSRRVIRCHTCLSASSNQSQPMLCWGAGAVPRCTSPGAGPNVAATSARITRMRRTAGPKADRSLRSSLPPPAA